MRQYLFNFYLSKIKSKRPEVNSEPTHFPTLMNNIKAFTSLDGMTCSYQCSDQVQFLPEHWPAKRYWISWDFEKQNLFKNNLPEIIYQEYNRNNIKSQILYQKNGGIVELLMPTLNRNIRNQGSYFAVIMNNRLKIISVYGAPLQSMRGFFPKKKLLIKGQKLFWAKKL